MLIMCDRKDGIFTPKMSDRINQKSTMLWEKIQDLSVPAIYPKLSVYSEEVNVNNITFIKEKTDASFNINSLLHIVNFRVSFSAPVSLNGTTIGQLPIAPNGDIIVSFNDGEYLVIVQKGTNEIKCWSGTSVMQVAVYFTYVT